MMRLLERSSDGALQLRCFDEQDVPPYAILSHTWIPGQEVTYEDLVHQTGFDKAGYKKLEFCLDRAAADGLQYCWIDTCCINRNNGIEFEFTTAINCMFRWYQRARKCYVYLSDVQVPDDVTDAEAFPISWMMQFRLCRWFTRGWTLPELLAPASVGFFDKDGKYLGNKRTLERDIQAITKIPINVLRGKQPLDLLSVEERLSWVASRATKFPEDKVYCMLGIFGVFLTPIYGEGEVHAERRLREQLQKPDTTLKSFRNGNGWKHAAEDAGPKRRCWLVEAFINLMW